MAKRAPNSHPFGELLAAYRTRQPDLTQRRLAELAGYDPAVVARMARGGKDLTGPSGRDRVLRIVEILIELGLLSTVEQAGELLSAAGQPPLFDGHLAEARLRNRLAAIAGQASGDKPGNTRVRRTNMPAPITSFVGRGRELQEVRRMLAGYRLVTLTGVGGTGKTRLAQRAGADALLDYADGVWYVELAVVEDFTQLGEVIARIFGLTKRDQPAVETLIEHMRNRQLLLILDNGEHLLDALAKLVLDLLRGCPGLTVLLTSREGLNVEGELIWPVPPLDAPEAGQLFAERVATNRAGIIGNSNPAAVAEICERLDRLPLAIELAASHVAALGLDGVAARLDNRLTLLVRGRRGAPPRHQTLRAVIDWSHDTLSMTERWLFRRLAVFADGWTLDHAVTIDDSESIDRMDVNVPEAIAGLVAKSLVYVQGDGHSVRYYFLETIREFALDRLRASDEESSCHDAHARYFSSLSERLWELSLTDIQSVLRLVRSDYANFLAALKWCFGQGSDVSRGATIVLLLTQFWDNETAFAADGRRWFKRAFDSMDERVSKRIQGWLFLLHAWFVDDYDSETYFATREQAYTMLGDAPEGDVWGQVLALGHMSAAQHFVRGDDIGATALIDRCASIARRSGGQVIVQSMLMQRFAWADYSGRTEEAAQLALELIGLARSHHDPVVECEGLIDLGRTNLRINQVHQARAHFDQACQLARANNDPGRAALALALASLTAEAEGQHEQSLVLAVEGNSLASDYPDSLVGSVFPAMVLALAFSATGEHRKALLMVDQQLRRKPPRTRWIGLYVGLLEAKAVICARQGMHAQAAMLFGAADADRERQHGNPLECEIATIQACADNVRASIGDSAYSTAYSAGRKMRLQDAIAFLPIGPAP